MYVSELKHFSVASGVIASVSILTEDAKGDDQEGVDLEQVSTQSN